MCGVPLREPAPTGSSSSDGTVGGLLPTDRLARALRLGSMAATELFLSGTTDAQIEQMSKLPPLERLGQADDIANVVSFLVGPDGGWVNGQVLRANMAASRDDASRRAIGASPWQPRAKVRPFLIESGITYPRRL